MKEKWEYKMTKIGAGGFIGGKINESELEFSMNELGSDGWELVAVFDTNQSGGQSRDVFAVLKRSL